MTKSYGKHLAFPFQVSPDGRAAQVAALEEHVKDELLQLLLTGVGERAFLPEFGGGVRQLVFEPLGEATLGMAKARLTQAITTYLGHRVTLEDLKVEAAASTLDIEIKYRIAGTEDSRVLRFQRSGE
ncbi:MAG: GPW/gp25 family protein [Anaerolineales bacterium]